MNKPVLPYRVFPLGDAAITVDFGNCIDENINNEVMARYNQIKQDPWPGIIEIVPAYSSFTIQYDVLALRKNIPQHETVFENVKQQLNERLQIPVQHDSKKIRLIKIPVCYEQEFAKDIFHLAATKHISVEEVIQIHTSRIYKVFMLGFLPGFAYMGETDEKISMPRKPQPVNIEEGSVGIAGRQTGIYPLDSPGGWNIIGRTPLRIFNAEKEEPILLNTGDSVQFYVINKIEFEKIKHKELQNQCNEY